MADFPPFAFTTQESWYGELSFKAAEDGSALPLTGRQFEMHITPATSGSQLVPPVLILTTEEGRGLTLKQGDPGTLVFRVPKTTANDFPRGEFTADVLEVVGGERYLFMPVRITYAEPSGLRAFLTRFLGVSVSFAARQQPIYTPLAVPGREGRPGATIITGTVPPVSADGKDGDFYIETRPAGQGRRMYGPKAGGQWPGTPWNIQVAAISDVPGLTGALDAKAPNRIAPTGGATERLLADWLRVIESIYGGDPEDSANQMFLGDSAGNAIRYGLFGSKATGPVLMPVGGVAKDKPAVFSGNGKGGHLFINGAGRLFEIEDDGTNLATRNRLIARGGALNRNPRLRSTYGMDLATSGFGQRFSFMAPNASGVDRIFAQVFAYSADPIYATQLIADSTYARVRGSNQNVTGGNGPIALQAAGLGSAHIINDSGSIARFDGVDTPDSFLVFKNAAAGGFPLISCADTAKYFQLLRADIRGKFRIVDGRDVAPVAGGTLNVATIDTYIRFLMSAAVNGYTINLPDSPPDGTEVYFTADSTLSGLVWTPPAGASIIYAPTAIASNVSVRLRYFASNKRWYKWG
ncbi:hypothetical protein LPC10_01655 [Methylorubrum sp. B1-46]|uniref:hypothetical protein n=1 Tax=Methylorubrum sp. B1-46 TaxID=2897334 RepID=UPI001E4E5861|nr:hypothetical protein [Methylorubrum sp. B1-46]UGB26345.1 hypothetical protein LPC10_01655 [Methylorubrum sp. B1-46]